MSSALWLAGSSEVRFRGTCFYLGLAFYGTWMGESGLFACVVARFAAAKTDMTVDGSGSMDNTALSLSGEVGYRYDLAKGFFVEPQAEVAYTYVDADKLCLGSATRDYDASESLITRVGAVVGLSSPNKQGQRLCPGICRSRMPWRDKGDRSGRQHYRR